MTSVTKGKQVATVNPSMEHCFLTCVDPLETIETPSSGAARALNLSPKTTIEAEKDGVLTQTLPDLDEGKTGEVKAWTKLFAGNRSAENGTILSYIPPDLVNGTVVVKLEQAEIEKEADRWTSALIIYVVGDTPRYNYM